MGRSSIRGLMLAVVLAALVLALVAQLGGEAAFYGVAPVAGAILAVRSAPRDRWAGPKGGALGGLAQGIVGPLALGHGYPFPDPAMMTGGLFLQSLAIHQGLGIVFGLLVGAIAGSGPRSAPTAK